MDYILTNNGAVLMTQVAAGRTILFTRTESGSGYAANPTVLQNVVDKKQDMFLEEVIFENRQATIKTVLSNMQLEEGYQLRQVGVYAKLEGDEADTLVIIGQQYNGEKIPPYGEGIIQIEYDIAMRVSGTGNVTIEGVGTGYVTKGQFLAHLNDQNNPHQVTKKKVGLEHVPNVATNDQTPTFEEAEERENIVSGEKLSVIMGKVRKWFSDLKEAAFYYVANNLLTTLPGFALDARQGKVLEDQITQLYSDISVRYNAESDYVQIRQGAQWIDWMLAELLFDGYLYRNGIFQMITGFDVTWSTSNASTQGYCTFGDNSIAIRSYGYNNGASIGKHMYPQLMSKESVNMRKYTKLSMKYSARISHTGHYIDIGLSLKQQTTTKNSVRITSQAESVGTLSINIPANTTDQVVIDVSSPYHQGATYGDDWYGYCTITELRLE